MGSAATVTRQGLALFVPVAALALALYGQGFSDTAFWVMAAGLWCLAVFAFVSERRHREVLRMSAEVDEVLHRGRTVEFSDCREGDLAILRNVLGKMVSRLARTSRLLAAERNALADSLADISHQIRTPLTAMGLMLSALERADDPAERKRAVRQVELLMERVSWLVTTLLKLAKADAGALAAESVPVDVRRAVQDASAPLATALDLRGVEVHLEVDEGTTFDGDRRWIAEALENIIKNCMEHTPEGGTITVAASTDALATRIRITDTGPGIAAEDLPRIFERFYRAEAKVGSGVSEGFGIGLALSRALIGAQGGTVTAGNVPGGGARFDIVFPHLTV